VWYRPHIEVRCAQIGVAPLPHRSQVRAPTDAALLPCQSGARADRRVAEACEDQIAVIEVPDVAQPHMEKLPISGLVDFVVEMRGDGKMPLVKTWKVKSGDSTCMYFNGKECK